MTERDTDIEFDFFDEPETEEATERVRTPRRPPPRGPRRPVRPPAGVIPMLRLAGLIAFLILAAVLLVVVARGCASSGKHDRYETYIRDVRGIAGRSEQIGKELNRALAATGIKESELETKITGLAANEQVEVEQARKIDPPGRERAQSACRRISPNRNRPQRDHLRPPDRRPGAAARCERRQLGLLLQGTDAAGAGATGNPRHRRRTGLEHLPEPRSSEHPGDDERVAACPRCRHRRHSRRLARERPRLRDGVAGFKAARPGRKRE
jgi:hypothetical protein